jgi:hypothetical protein
MSIRLQQNEAVIPTVGIGKFRCRGSLALLGASLCCLISIAQAQGNGNAAAQPNARPGTAQAVQVPAAPDIHIEFFGAERGYAAGMENVTLLCVVRNAGTAPLPENTLQLRLFPAAGLDYTSGETMPSLPALAPNQAVAFRWRLAPAAGKGPLVADLLLQGIPSSLPTAAPSATNGGSSAVSSTPTVPLPAPRVVMTVVPRLPVAPTLGRPTTPPDAAPLAEADAGQGWVGNDRVGARVIAAEGRVPILLLAGREGPNWVATAQGISLAQTRSGEEGQNPWWETFRWRTTRLQHDPDSATLTLEGTVGARWRAELILTAQRDSSVLNGRLRLTALRPMRLYNVQIPILLAAGETAESTPPRAEGSALPVAADAPILPDNARVLATRTHGITFGLAWPSMLPLPGWRANVLPAGDGDRLHVLGVRYEGDERGELISSKTTVEFAFRLFALSPSDTVRDALRFLMP